MLKKISCNQTRNGFSLLEVMIVGGLLTIVGLAITSVITNSTKAQKRLEQKSSQISIAGYIQGILQNPEICRRAFCQTASAACASGGTNCCTGNDVWGAEAGDLRTSAGAYPTVATVPGLINLASIQLSTGANHQVIQRCDSGAGFLCNNNPAAYNALTNVPPSTPPLGAPVIGTPGFFVYGLRIANLTYMGLAGADHVTMGEIVLQYSQDAKISSGGKLQDSVMRVLFSANGTGQMTACKTGASDSLWSKSPVNAANIFYNIGNVGIGNDDPQFDLDIQKSNFWSQLRVHTTSVTPGHSGALILSRDRGVAVQPQSGDTLGVLAFRGVSAVNNPAMILATATENHSGAAAGTSLIFSTTPNTTIATTERMRISENGNVGIGTTPESSLHIQTATTSNLKVRSSGAVGAGRSIIQVLRGFPETGWDFSTNISLANEELTIRELTAGVATTRLSILPGGNVGIGTTTPQARLEINNGAVRLNAGVAPASDAATVGIAFEDNGDTGLFMTNYASAATGDLNLFNNAIARLTVQGTNVGISNIAPGRSLDVTGTFRADAGGGSIEIDVAANLVTVATPSQFNGQVTVGTAGTPQNFAQTGNQNITGNITTTGVFTAGAVGITHTITGAVLHTGGAGADLVGDTLNRIRDYLTITAVSDARLKDDIQKIESVSEQLNQINSYRYIMRKDPTQKKHIGFIAQELLEIFPELVSEGESGYLNVNYMGMVPLLLQGFKESQTRIQDLESENEHLKLQISQILERVENLEKF